MIGRLRKVISIAAVSRLGQRHQQLDKIRKLLMEDNRRLALLPTDNRHPALLSPALGLG